MTTITPAAFYDAMARVYFDQTGFDPAAASDIGIRFKALAQELSYLSESVCAAWRDAFPQTAYGNALDYHAQCAGLGRKPALPAGGTLRFSRVSPAADDISIPAGTVCASPDGVLRFETTAPGAIRTGALSADIPAVSLTAGIEGNVPSGTVRVIISAPPGIRSVTNPGAFAGGCEAEPDDGLRLRVMQSLSDPPTPANAAYYRGQALAFPGVRTAAVLPGARGAGSVDLVIAALPGHDPDETAAALAKSLEDSVLLGVDLSVYPAEQARTDVAAMVTLEPGYDPSDVLSRCKVALADYVSGLSIGAPLLRARITACLLSVEGVENLRVVYPSQDRAVFPHQVVTASVIDVERVGSL